MSHCTHRNALNSGGLRPWLLAWVVLLVAASWVRGADAPVQIIVGHDDAGLYGRADEESPRLRELGSGQVLTPLAGIDSGKQRWYFVKTDDGAQGWVLAEEVDGAGLEQTLKKRGSAYGGTTASATMASSAYGNRKTKVAVQMNGGAIFVPVRLNRSLETRMMMDTGATLTVITPRLAKRLRLKPRSKITLLTANGRISAPVANLSSLRVGNSEVRNIPVAVHDFGPGSGIGGLLGLNFLRQFETSVDSEKQVLTLKPN